MKIGKIILLVLAAVLIALSIKALSDVPSRKAKLENAVELNSAEVLSENEGKLVIIHGVPEITRCVYDDQWGISLNTFKAIRQTQVYDESVNDKDEYTWDWRSKETKILTGGAKIGEFILDESVIRAFPADDEYRDFDEFEIRGYNLSTGGIVDSRVYVMPYGGYYYDKEMRDADSMNIMSYLRTMRDRVGTLAINYRAFDLNQGREMTVVAVQRGNTLEAHDKLGVTVKTGVVGKDKIISSDGTGITVAAVIGLVLGAVLVYFGVRKPKAADTAQKKTQVKKPAEKKAQAE